MRRASILAAALLLAACQGVLTPPSGTCDAESDRPCRPGGGIVEQPLPECDGVCTEPTPMMRITRTQYDLLVREMFGDGVAFDASRLPQDGTAGSFTSNPGEVTQNAVEEYDRAATELAAEVAPSVTLGCDPDADAASCGREIFERYGAVAYRRAVTPEDARVYEDLFAWSYPDDGLVGATELVLATLLSAPAFLYRIETVLDDGAPHPLDNAALAARLALFLWDAAPDQALRDADLSDPEQLAAQTRRMLEDPRADVALASFHREWLGLDEISEAVPRPVADALRAETEAFAVSVFRDGGSLERLVTSSEASLDETLAAHYEVPAGADTLEGRHGILTYGAVLAAHTSPSLSRPIHRGLFLREVVLCSEPLGQPAVLPDIEQEAEALPTDLSDRDKLEALTTEAGGSCAHCHTRLNPPGHAFSAFDEVGRYQPLDAFGDMVDTSGDLVGLGDLDGSFGGIDDLAPRMVDSETFTRCMTRSWLGYALLRSIGPEDEWSVRESTDALLASGGDLREMIVALVLTDAFRHRAAPVSAPSDP